MLHRLATATTRRLLRNPDDAEDAAQEAILRAFRAVESGAEPANVEAWLRTIARREAFRVYGRRKSSDRMLQDLPSPGNGVEAGCIEATGPAGPDPADAMVDRLTVRQLLSDVTPDARELLLRRYALDQSSSEIAIAVNIPANTVRVRLHRTLGQMRVSQSAGL